jgi:hypothetical protein
MFETETAEEMILKGVEGRYQTRKGILLERIALRKEMAGQGWVAGVDPVKNAAILAEYQIKLAQLETEYTRARNLLVGVGIADCTVVEPEIVYYTAVNR